MKAPAISERDWQRTVIEAAQTHGWLAAHFRPGLTKRGRWITAVSGNGKGFPDLLLVHPKRGRIIAAELKAEGGHTTPEQDAWLKAFSMVGATAAVWYPRDWPHVEKELAA